MCIYCIRENTDPQSGLVEKMYSDPVQDDQVIIHIRHLNSNQHDFHKPMCLQRQMRTPNLEALNQKYK